MDLPNQRFRGIVTVMGDEAHRDRTDALGSALGRLSAARSRRGSVGMIDPFDLTSHEPQYAAAGGMPHAVQRRGLFTFSARARAAVEPAPFVDYDDLDD